MTNPRPYTKHAPLDALPDWISALPDKAMLNTNDIAEILKIPRPTLQKRLEARTFPEPDFKAKTTKFKRDKNYWCVKTLKRWFEQQKPTPAAG